MKLNQIAFALVATLGVVGAAQAATVSGQSDEGTGYIYFDNSDPSQALVGVDGVVIGTTEVYNFPHLTAFGADANDVYSFISSTAFAPLIPWGVPAEHQELGAWSFKQVDSTATPDVWFGSWAQENKDANGDPDGTVNASTYTVFYSGSDASTSAPTTGTATYAVEGINNYNTTDGLLTGTLTANFGAGNSGTLAGTLSRSTGTVTSLAINAAIDASDATFAGSATANGTVSGTSEGQFYGANVDSLAGIAVFTDRAYDTAFGGVKQ